MKRPRCVVADGIDRERYYQSLGRFQHGFARWTWWVTLTFKGEVSELAAEKAFRTFARKVARELAHDHVAVAWAWEPQLCGVPAFHALLAIAERRAVVLQPAAFELAWKQSHRAAGFIRVERYEASEGAAWYQAAHRNWDINVACPRRPACRRLGVNGCRRAPGPW